MTSETPIGEQWAQLAIEMLSELRQDYAPGELKETDGRKAIAWLRSKLAAKEAEIAELREKLDRYTRRSESGESLEDYFDLVGELEKERAKVVRLREALLPFSHADLREIHSNNVEGNSSPVFGRNNAKLLIGDFCRAADTLASLDAQAERDAAVLRGAEEIHKAHEGRETELFVGIPACPICQAVRGDKKVNTSD